MGAVLNVQITSHYSSIEGVKLKERQKRKEKKINVLHTDNTQFNHVMNTHIIVNSKNYTSADSNIIGNYTNNNNNIIIIIIDSFSKAQFPKSKVSLAAQRYVHEITGTKYFNTYT